MHFRWYFGKCWTESWWNGLEYEAIKEKVVKGQRLPISREYEAQNNPIIFCMLDVMKRGWSTEKNRMIS